jgi:hypothetical protein
MFQGLRIRGGHGLLRGLYNVGNTAMGEGR